MGWIVIQLLAESISKQKAPANTPRFKWVSRPMRFVVDLSDQDEVYRILDKDH